MTIVAISDQHGTLPEIPPCDLLLIAGDICPVRESHAPHKQQIWFHDHYNSWLESLPATEIVLIAGNHDFLFEKELVPNMPGNVAYLQDTGCTRQGFNIWGTPYTPWFHDWAFNAGHGPEDGPEREAGLDEIYAKIPLDTDILLSHGPPYHYLDRNARGEHCGSRALLNRIKHLPKLRLTVFGHIHEDGGKRMYFRNGQIANVSILNDHYKPAAEPTLFKGL